MSVKNTALYANHKKRGAKCVSFAGYNLPVWFSSIKEEHKAVREKCGAFDISHMALFFINGADAESLLQSVNCNDLNKSKAGKMVYSMVLNEEGKILDDVMFGPLDTGYLLVANAANKDKIENWLHQHKPESVDIDYLNDDFAFIAIQGPKSLDIIDHALDINTKDHKRFSIYQEEILGYDSIVLRTGYTGENGAELAVPNDIAIEVWDRLISGGAIPCGLAARDSLRIEAGLPLYGFELSEKITPLRTRYKWVLAMDTDFIGKEAILKQEKDGEANWTTVGIEMFDRQIPRSHYPIKEGGEVTSGTLSPLTDKAIGMAMVPKDVAEKNKTLHVEIRGKEYEAKIVDIPFF
jgi:aminomethyltransferase